MITLRPYQQEAIDAVYDYWASETGNPLIELATGLGKSLVIAELCRQMITRFRGMRILCLVHVRELVRQNYEEMKRLWPDAPVGIYSAGLNSRDAHNRIVIASIQSVHRKAQLLAPRQLVIIDECHLVPSSGEGMYTRMLDGLRMAYPSTRVLGLTATPYRLDSGRLDQGDNRIFHRIVYKCGVGEGVELGYLSPLTAKAGDVEINVDGVHRRGGEFIASELNRAAADDAIVRKACADIVARGADRKSWLIFCCGIDHAEQVAIELKRLGIAAEAVSSETDKDVRDQRIKDFKAGKLRALTNAMVLTTGFNAPNVDLIAFLRPTLSTGLYIQMAGRGTRKAEGKENCLLLDYAGNVRRHGPVDMVHPKTPNPTGGAETEAKVAVDEVRAKQCPQCGALMAIQVRECTDCGHVFGEPKHTSTPDLQVAAMAREISTDWTPVISWSARLWIKKSAPEAPPTMRVTHMVGVTPVHEWVCFEHTGYARNAAIKWWMEHGGELPVPSTVDQALKRFIELTPPQHVSLGADGSFMKIKQRRFKERQKV